MNANTGPGTLPRTCVIFNPTARGDKARHFRDFLNSLPREVVLRPTTGPGAARGLATQAAMEGFERIVAAGGDGTVNEVVNGLEDVPDGAGWERAALGVLPLGTVNVFALELGIPLNLEAAWLRFQEGTVKVVDLPVAEWIQEGIPQRRAFAQLGGAGLDARAVALVRWEEKKRWGRWAYVLAGFRALRSGLPQIRVTTSEGRQTRGQLVLFGNGTKYGGHFPIFPEARMSDGRLDFTVFETADLSALIRFGAGWLTGDIARFGGVICGQAESFKLESPLPMEFELDGDNVGMLPLTLRVLRSRMRVVA